LVALAHLGYETLELSFSGRSSGLGRLLLLVFTDAGVLAVATAATHLRSRIEEDFHLSIRKYGCTYISSFHDDAARLAKLALGFDHPGAKLGVDGDLGGAGGDVGVADAAGDVHSVEQDAVAFELWFQRDAGAGGELK
jgi:hypothetical protein